MEQKMNSEGLKILLVSQFFYSSFGWSIARALKILKAEVTEFEMISHSFQRVPFLRNIRLTQINQNLIKIANALKPDLIFVVKGNLIFKETIQKIQNIAPTILWFQDAMIGDYPILGPALPFYNKIFCIDPYLVMSLRKIGIPNSELLAHCCDTELHALQNLSVEDKRIYGSPLNIVGACYPWRWMQLKPFSQKGLRIWGPGWKKLDENSPLKPCVTGREARGLEQAKVFQSSCVSLNTHQLSDVLGANQRVFDIAGSGGTQVCDFKEDIVNYFEPDREIILYQSNEEMLEKVNYLLKNPKKAKEIGKRAYQVCRDKEYTYEGRMKELLSKIDL